MNKPIIAGMCVLEISKVLMYSFLYEYLKPKYGQNIQVVYTDTDSFVLEIKTPDVYADIRNDMTDMFDTWDYPEDNIYGIERRNNKIPGKFKDELKGEIATDFVGVRSKCYALRTLGRIDDDQKKKGNCVEKSVSEKKISFDDYYNCVKNNCIEMRNQYSFRSKDLNVCTISTDKIALNSFDDKQYMGRIDKMKKGKGVKKSVLKKEISFDDYYNCVKNNCIEVRKQYSIRSKNHNVYTISTEKIALNPFDDKRYIIKPDGINTLAWGHHQIDAEKMDFEYQNILDRKQRMLEFMKDSKA